MFDKADIDFAWYTWVFIAIGLIGMLGWLRVDLNAKVLAILLTTEILVVILFDLVVLGDPGSRWTLPATRSTRRSPSAPGSAARSASRWPPSSASSRRPSTARSARTRAARSREPPTSRSASPRSSTRSPPGCCRARSAPRSSPTRTRWSRAASSAPPAGPTRRRSCSSRWTCRPRRRSPTSRRCSSAPACSPPRSRSTTRVARYFFALGRARVIPSAFGRMRANGAPFIGSPAQTIIAATVVAIFALSDNDPVLQLFTWLTNLGAMGVILLLALASFAIVGYFSKYPHSESTWTSQIAPGLAGLGLTMVFILVLANFNLLITGVPDAPTDDRSIILPAILIGGGDHRHARRAVDQELEARRLRADRRDGRGGDPLRVSGIRGRDQGRSPGRRPVPDLRPAASRVARRLGARGRDVAGDELGCGGRRRLRPRAVRGRHAGLADRSQLRQPDDPHLRRRAAPRAAALDRSQVPARRRRGVHRCARRADRRRAGSTRSRTRARRTSWPTSSSRSRFAAWAPCSASADVDDETLRRWFAALADGATNFEARRRQAGAKRRRLRGDRGDDRADARAPRARARRLDDLPHDPFGTWTARDRATRTCRA